MDFSNKIKIIILYFWERNSSIKTTRFLNTLGWKLGPFLNPFSSWLFKFFAPFPPLNVGYNFCPTLTFESRFCRFGSSFSLEQKSFSLRMKVKLGEGFLGYSIDLTWLWMSSESFVGLQTQHAVWGIPPRVVSKCFPFKIQSKSMVRKSCQFILDKGYTV